jgi:hypothetical protein
MERVEAVARAMCSANGFEPDDTAADPFRVSGQSEPFWKMYSDDARKFIAAWEVMNDQVG